MKTFFHLGSGQLTPATLDQPLLCKRYFRAFVRSWHTQLLLNISPWTESYDSSGPFVFFASSIDGDLDLLSVTLFSGPDRSSGVLVAAGLAVLPRIWLMLWGLGWGRGWRACGGTPPAGIRGVGTARRAAPAANPASPAKPGWWWWCPGHIAIEVEASVPCTDTGTETGRPPISGGSLEALNAGCKATPAAAKTPSLSLLWGWLWVLFKCGTKCRRWSRSWDGEAEELVRGGEELVAVLQLLRWVSLLGVPEAVLWAVMASTGRPPAELREVTVLVVDAPSWLHWPPAASQRPGWGGGGRPGVDEATVAGGGGGELASLRGEPEDDGPGLGCGDASPASPSPPPPPRLGAQPSLSRVRSSGGDSTSRSMSSSSSSSSWDMGGESGMLVPTPPFNLQQQNTQIYLKCHCSFFVAFFFFAPQVDPPVTQLRFTEFQVRRLQIGHNEDVPNELVEAGNKLLFTLFHLNVCLHTTPNQLQLYCLPKQYKLSLSSTKSHKIDNLLFDYSINYWT